MKSYQIEPLGVVLPRLADETAAVISITSRHGLPVLPRGGSSLAGQAVGAAAVIDTSKYLIAQLSSRKPLHLAQFLAEALS